MDSNRDIQVKIENYSSLRSIAFAGFIVQVAAGGQKLHILKAQTSHGARYTCTARNEAGEAHLDFTVIVLGMAMS